MLYKISGGVLIKVGVLVGTRYKEVNPYFQQVSVSDTFDITTRANQAVAGWYDSVSTSTPTQTPTDSTASDTFNISNIASTIMSEWSDSTNTTVT